MGDPPPRGHFYTRANIVAGVHQSLARLQTDYLDVVQFHGAPSRELLAQEDASQTLLDLQREHEHWITKAAEKGAGIVIRGGVAQGEPGEGSCCDLAAV